MPAEIPHPISYAHLCSLSVERSLPAQIPIGHRLYLFFSGCHLLHSRVNALLTPLVLLCLLLSCLCSISKDIEQALQSALQPSLHMSFL
jgi:hypothetical protein